MRAVVGVLVAVIVVTLGAFIWPTARAYWGGEEQTATFDVRFDYSAAAVDLLRAGSHLVGHPNGTRRD